MPLPPNSNNSDCLYNKLHLIQIWNPKDEMEQKTVNVTIKNYYNALQIKIHDVNSYLFNYTAHIDMNTFQIMRNEQLLEIAFEELGTHLLEMLLLHHNKQMLLKCIMTTDSRCRLIFYERSKIKSLIFLTIELSRTDQKELFEEMDVNMKMLQDTNKTLSKQLSSLQDVLRSRETQITQYQTTTQQMEKQFLKDIHKINEVYVTKLKQCETLIATKLVQVSERIVKLLNDVSVVRSESNMKCASGAKLAQRMENLRVENLENVSALNRMRTECSNYERMNKEYEVEISNLRETGHEKDRRFAELQERLDEYRKDLENSAFVIAKKSELYEELRRDMDQANQVIRNYNKHYDVKSLEVEELRDSIHLKDNLIKEQIFQNNQLFKEYQEYKLRFNSDESEKLMLEMITCKNKLETLEKEKREIVKLNGLLTKKLSSSGLYKEDRNM